MTFYSPGSVFIHIGLLSIRYYGLMYLLGYLFAISVIKHLAQNSKINFESLSNCALICFLAGIAGARIYYAALNWHYFAANPLEVFAIWHGGMSIHGGIIGGLTASIIYCKINKISALSTGDIFGTAIPLAQSIGRWGNFFNNELFGSPVPDSFPLKQYIPPELRPAQFSSCQYFHPTFLYESAWDLALFLFLYFFVLPRFKHKPGITFCVYLAVYSLGRILIEPLRLDSIMAGGIKIPLVVSWLFLIFSVLAIFVLQRRKSIIHE